MIYIENVTVLTPDTQHTGMNVLAEGGRIRYAAPGAPPGLPEGVRKIDGAGLTLTPGLIELQLNGAFGDDFTAQPDTIWRVAAKLGQYGVTSFLPTIITSPLEQGAEARRVLMQERPADFCGTEPLGLHLEGPFLNPQKKGAHNPRYLQLPDQKLVRDWTRENGVRLVTLAPELPGALDLVREFAARGIVVSAGHTMATASEAQAGFDAGIRYATHLYNAMPPIESRDPKVAGAVLANPEWVTGLIPDGIHVHPTLVAASYRAKGKALNLVSDAMAALGMPPGIYKLNDFDVVVSDRDARLRDGTLAGSILPLDQGVRNLVAFTGCMFGDALAAVTTTPAAVLGIAHERGRLEPGYIADMTLWDADLNVVATISAGNLIYHA